MRKVHYFQQEILKQLASGSSLRFSQIEVKDLESEHINYHLHQLIKMGLVKKVGQRYELTNGGKDFINTVDSETGRVEKMPKVSVLLRIVRQNPTSGAYEDLLMKRKNEPYKGRVGRMTGKVRFGERFVEAARRELMEETGLLAETVELVGIYHKIRFDSEECVQDVIFVETFILEPKGELIEETPFQSNFWASPDELKNRNDLFDDFEIREYFEPRRYGITENVAQAEGF